MGKPTDTFLFSYDNGKIAIYEVDTENQEKKQVVSTSINIQETCDSASVGVGEWRDYAPQSKVNGTPKDKKDLPLDFVFNTDKYYEPTRKEIVVGSDEKTNPLVKKSNRGNVRAYTTIHNFGEQTNKSNVVLFEFSESDSRFDFVTNKLHVKDIGSLSNAYIANNRWLCAEHKQNNRQIHFIADASTHKVIVLNNVKYSNDSEFFQQYRKVILSLNK